MDKGTKPSAGMLVTATIPVAAWWSAHSPQSLLTHDLSHDPVMRQEANSGLQETIAPTGSMQKQVGMQGQGGRLVMLMPLEARCR